MNTSILNPDETIIFETGKHPIFFFTGEYRIVFFASLIFSALWIFFYSFINPLMQNIFGTASNWLGIGIGVFIGAYILNAFLNYQYSRYILTNQRFIVHNGHGILSRETASFPRTALLILDVDQPLLGRILNYGNISISMMNKRYDYTCVANTKTLYEHFIR